MKVVVGIGEIEEGRGRDLGGRLVWGRVVVNGVRELYVLLK